MKRITLLAIVIALALLSVGMPSQAQEKIRIQLWHGWAGDYTEAITKVFEEYNETNMDGIEVELSNPGSMNDALAVAIPAGEGPDIAAWVNDVIGNQVVSGNIVPLDDYGIDMEFLESYYEPAAATAMVYNGKIWGLPETQEAISLICNKALISEEDLPSDPMDFDGLLEAAKKFREENPDKYLIVNQGWATTNDPYHNAPILHGFGGFFVNEKGEVGLNTPGGLKAGEWMAAMSDYVPAEIDYNLAGAMLNEGKAACWWTGPWAIKGIRDGGVDFFIKPFGAPMVGIKTLMLTKNAVDRGTAEAALKVMRYFTSAEVQAALSEINGTVPAQTEALKDPEVAANPVVIGVGAQAALGVPQPNTPYMSQLWGPSGDAFIAIWTKTQSPAEALEAAQQVAEERVEDLRPTVEGAGN